jgi:hypothetical protein
MPLLETAPHDLPLGLKREVIVPHPEIGALQIA